MENKLNLPLKKKKNEAESPRLDPLMRALKALHSAGAPETMTEEELEHFPLLLPEPFFRMLLDL